MSVFTENSALTVSEIKDLEKSSNTQNEFILKILRADPDRGYAIFQMIDMTDMHYSSVNRAMSSMSSDSHRYKDKFSDPCGRMPVIKRKDVTEYNESTGKHCCTYWANPHFGQPCGSKQTSIFD